MTVRHLGVPAYPAASTGVITVTALNSVLASGTPAQTRSTTSFTPAANSRVIMFVQFNFDGGTSLSDPVISANTITGWTTTLARTAISTRLSIGFEPFLAVFEGVMGASPTAGTVTVDFENAVASSWYSTIQVIGLTGTLGIPLHKQTMAAIKSQNDAGGNAVSHTTNALGSAATNGSTCIAAFSASCGTNAAPTTPSTWTLIGTASNLQPDVLGVYKKTDFTGTTVTCTDMGQGTDASFSELMELESI